MSRNQLASWISENAISRSELARKIGVTRSALSYYENGHRQPRLPIAHQISIVSNGAVPLDSWSGRSFSRSKGATVLLDWMARHGLDMTQAAAFYDVYPATMRYLIGGGRIPSHDTMAKLRANGPAEFADLRRGDFE